MYYSDSLPSVIFEALNHELLGLESMHEDGTTLWSIEDGHGNRFAGIISKEEQGRTKRYAWIAETADEGEQAFETARQFFTSMDPRQLRFFDEKAPAGTGA